MIETSLRDAGFSKIAGVDEAGRGACAGPLVVAAVILKDFDSAELSRVRDSKELTAKVRKELYPKIIKSALAFSVIRIEAEEIDRIGLHKANLEGMRRAISALEIQPDYILTDGYQVPGLPSESLAVWKGDQVAQSISAASILAKVFRDRIMDELDVKYPEYGFSQHKGYVTKVHQKAIESIGILPIHRTSYANVAKLIHR